MQKYKLHYNKGKYHLAKHENTCALKEFKKALSFCEQSNKGELATISYYVGITLKKMNLVNPAINSWLLAQKLHKRSYSRKMIVRFVNEYGMSKQKNIHSDDKNAFFALQLLRYLENKKSRRLGTTAEKHMIMDLIEEHWLLLEKSGKLKNKNCELKMNILESIKISFPFFTVPEFSTEKTIKVDFNNKNKVEMLKKCLCGSGIPYGMCCGRIKGVSELQIGAF